MPYYDYEICDEQTGEVKAVIAFDQPVDQRDSLVLRRRTVPDRVEIPGSAGHPALGREGFAGLVRKGYQALEEKHGSRLDLSQFGGKKGVKEIWS